MQAPTTQQSSDALDSLARLYAQHELFQRRSPQAVLDNPWRRRVVVPTGRLPDAPPSMYEEWVNSHEFLFLVRTLLTIYERDFVLLPKRGFHDKLADFRAFYGTELTELGERIRPRLEQLVFSALDNTVEVSGTWTFEKFRTYYEASVAAYSAESHGRVTSWIPRMRDPKVALHFYLIQAACDFLVESSAMARNTIGNYGAVQSEFFKIVIDESGYGVDRTRHSTLFEKVLESVGLDSTPHTYWDYYLPSTLLTASYYNYIGKNHLRVFRYIGGLLHVESCFRITCKQMETMMKAVHGANAVVDYFAEHVHIDDHHSRMALENIVRPCAEQYGPWALSEIVRGFEESQAIGELHVLGLQRQLALIERVQERRLVTVADGARVAARHSLGAGAWTELCVGGGPEILKVESGQIVLHVLPGCELQLGPTQAFELPAGSFSQLRAESDCKYATLQ